MQENGAEHRRPDPPNRAHRGDVGVILQRKHALATTYHHTERTLSTTEHPVPLIRHDPVSRALRARSFGAPSRNSARVLFEKRPETDPAIKRATSVHLQTEQRDTRATGQPNNPVRWRQRRPSRTRVRWFRTAVLSTREGVLLLESPIHLIKCWVRSACGGLRRLWACVALDASRV